jgi:heme/copper-type cytochrome/quinol oxidase subunit 4
MNTNKKNKSPKSEEFINEALIQIEKIVDQKLNNIKTFTPILLTIITSVIAFLLAMETDIKQDSAKAILLALGVLLVSFFVMIISYFGKISYKAKEKKKKTKFEPHQFDSYCYLSDENFLTNLKEYASRNLTDKESLLAKTIKQKINECIYRRNCVNIALVIVEIGSAILAISCFILIFIE